MQPQAHAHSAARTNSGLSISPETRSWRNKYALGHDNWPTKLSALQHVLCPSVGFTRGAFEQAESCSNCRQATAARVHGPPSPDGKPPAVPTAEEASKQPVLGELCGLISLSQSCFYFPSVSSQRPYHRLLTRCYFSYPQKTPFCVFYAYFLANARGKTGIFEVFQIKPHVACSSENSLNAETHAKGLALPFAPSASALAGSR